MVQQILIRADDLGYCEGINYGIGKTVRDGIVRSVGLMPNMPSAAHGLSLLEGCSVCLGQHTNICVGRPLTDPSRIPSLCDSDGNFKTSKVYRTAEKDFVALDEVVLEIEAQYQQFVKLTGRQPGYFEGHAVRSANFFKGLEIVAARHGLPLLKMGFAGPVLFRHTLLYSWLESSRPDYHPFETLQRACEGSYEANGCPMLVLHPGYLDAYILHTSSLTIPRTEEVEMACSQTAQDYLRERNIRVVTYDELD